jgi:hypothetical protein
LTRIAELYQKFLNKRPITFAGFQRLLEAFDYRLDQFRDIIEKYDVILDDQ